MRGKAARIDNTKFHSKPGWRETRQAYLQQLGCLYKELGIFAPLACEGPDSGPLTLYKVKYGIGGCEVSAYDEMQIIAEERRDICRDWKYVPAICFHPTCLFRVLVFCAL